MRKMIQRALSFAAFFTLLFAVLAGLSRLLEYKGSREKLAPFLACAQQVDVLFLGDSHTYSDVYPVELWADYGIAAYNLASYNMTIPMSYWTLQNALRVCQPKVVVLDVNEIWEHAKLGDSSGDAHLALDGYPLSPVKLQAILDLMDDPQLEDKTGQRYMDLRPEYILPFIKYHVRWSDLSAEDLTPNYEKELGGERNIGVAKPDAYTLTYAEADEQGYGFAYLRRFIEDCQAAGIRVLLTNLPYPCSNNNDEQLYTNAVPYVAAEYGVEYIDFVYMDQVVDYSTDCYDPGSHLNPSGAWKVTDLLGQHLSEAYGLPDHREEAAYASWNDDLAAYRALKLQSLRDETEPRSFVMLLADPSFSVVLLLPENSKVYSDALAMQLIQNAGRRHLMMADLGEPVWSDLQLPLELPLGQVNGVYMAVIDRAGGAISECMSDGEAHTAFGSVALDGIAGTATLTTPSGTFTLTLQPNEDLHAAILDPETGEVLYERAVRL